jgi:hypothetical protein
MAHIAHINGKLNSKKEKKQWQRAWEKWTNKKPVRLRDSTC